MTEQRPRPDDQGQEPQPGGSPEGDERLEDLEPEDDELTDEVRGGRTGSGAGKANLS